MMMCFEFTIIPLLLNWWVDTLSSLDQVGWCRDNHSNWIQFKELSDWSWVVVNPGQVSTDRNKKNITSFNAHTVVLRVQVMWLPTIAGKAAPTAIWLESQPFLISIHTLKILIYMPVYSHCQWYKNINHWIQKTLTMWTRLLFTIGYPEKLIAFLWVTVVVFQCC